MCKNYSSNERENCKFIVRGWEKAMVTPGFFFRGVNSGEGKNLSCE